MRKTMHNWNNSKMCARVLFVIAIVLPAMIPAILSAQNNIRVFHIGNLSSWYSRNGSEIEVGGPKGEQNEGLEWPCQFLYHSNVASKAMWIGTTDYADPITNTTYPYKVVGIGPRNANPSSEVMPVTFRMIARDYAPVVTVDGSPASDLSPYDAVDEVDRTLKADRMIVNEMNTSIGLTVTRKLLAFSQQNHDNYFVYEYTLKNTGKINAAGDRVIQKTLTGVMLFFEYRYTCGCELDRRGVSPDFNVSYGRNTIAQVIGTNPAAPGFEMRAEYSWYGHHSKGWPDATSDLGGPFRPDGHLGAAQFVGNVTLHADKSASDHSDDPAQPCTTYYEGSDDKALQYALDQYNATVMHNRYAAMVKGHAPVTIADQVGNGTMDTFGNDAGGYTQTEGYGPYTLTPGDSVAIVITEGVAGLNREQCYEIGGNYFEWYNAGSPASGFSFNLPDGTTTSNGLAYKDAWVWAGRDSLLSTFRRAINNYKNGYNMPQPPAPPNYFNVTSGGDRIRLDGVRTQTCLRISTDSKCIAG